MKTPLIATSVVAGLLAAGAASADPQIRGRLMVDVWATDSSIRSIDYPSGTDIRAARIGVFGTLEHDLAYAVEADFTGNQVTLKNTYLQYRGWDAATLTVGNHKPPFSLENTASLMHVTFMERALPNVFAFTQTIGASLARSNDDWTISGGVFGESPGVAIDGDEGILLAARATWAPMLDETRLVHLGVGSYYKHLGREAGAGYRIRQRPEVHAFARRLLDTGPFDADSTAAAGLEFAWVNGPISVQSEYMYNRVDYAHGGARFGGAYVYASWFLTGERRPYAARTGTFGRVIPGSPLGEGGHGAVELALRISTLDLEDGIVNGGTEDNLTLGLNWYLTSALRVTANWVYFEVENSTAMSPYGVGAHRGHALGLRAQLDW